MQASTRLGMQLHCWTHLILIGRYETCRLVAIYALGHWIVSTVEDKRQNGSWEAHVGFIEMMIVFAVICQTKLLECVVFI